MPHVHTAAFSLALVLIAVTGAAVPTISTNLTHVKLCYLYFGGITDLGWTFTYNLGRLKVHDQLALHYPNITFTSTIYQNVFYAANKQEIINNFLSVEKCSMILSNNGELLGGEDDKWTSLYPNVGFVLMAEYDPDFTNFKFKNRIYIAMDYSAGYYVAGTAAAAQTPKCIAFFAAWDNVLDPTNAFAGFLLGVRSVNATVPVHVVSQGSWFFPDSDQVLSELFLKVAGCGVLARYSDPNYVDLYVAGSGVTNSFSVGSHANLQQYVGDTVLTALYVDWSVPLLPLIRSWIENGTLPQSRPHIYGVKERAVIVAPVSPNAAPRAQTLATSVYERMVSTQNDLVVCGTVPLRKGGFVAVDAATNCKVPYLNIGDFITDANVLQHGTYPDRQQCPAGSFYRYAFKPLLTFTCTPCPANSYSSAAGSASCLACPAGEQSADGAVRCVAGSGVLGPGIIAAIVLGCIVALALLLALLYARNQIMMRNATAPRNGPLCLVVTDVDACTVLWRLQPHLMKEAMHRHDAIVRRVISENVAYEVKKTGDGFVIATATVVDAVVVAVEIQRCLMEVDWPVKLLFPGNQGDCWRGPRVSIGVHFCEAVHVSYDSVRQRYEYSGADVHTACRVGELAQGGQIVLSAETFEELRRDPQYDLIVEPDVVIRLWSIDAVLCDPLSPTDLFSLVPSELEGRVFALCPTGRPPPDTFSSTTDGGAPGVSLDVLNPLIPRVNEQSSDVMLNAIISGGGVGETVSSVASSGLLTVVPPNRGQKSQLSSGEKFSATSFTLSVLALLQWLTAAQRRQVISAMLHCIERRSASADILPQFDDGGASAASNHQLDGVRQEALAIDNDEPSRNAACVPPPVSVDQLRNPKRLVAAIALEITHSIRANEKKRNNEQWGGADNGKDATKKVRRAPSRKVLS